MQLQDCETIFCTALKCLSCRALESKQPGGAIVSEGQCIAGLAGLLCIRSSVVRVLAGCGARVGWLSLSC